MDSGHGLDLAHYFEPDTLCRVSLEDGETLELRLDGDAVLPGSMLDAKLRGLGVPARPVAEQPLRFVRNASLQPKGRP